MIEQLVQKYLAQSESLTTSGKRTVAHVANSWKRRAGGLDADAAIRFRKQAVADGLSPRTIESQISRIIGYCKAIGIEPPEVGRKLRLKPVAPVVPSMRDIESVFVAVDQCQWRSADWWRGTIVLSLWTGLRVEDLRLLEWADVKPDRIERVAGKTGKRHLFPLCHEVTRHLKAMPRQDATILNLKRGCVRFARRELGRLCEIAGVSRFGFQMLRRASITEWSSVNGDAGAIVHGTGLGVRRFYLDPLSVLRRSADQFAWPEKMRDAEELASKKENLAMLAVVAARLPLADISRLTRIAEQL